MNDCHRSPDLLLDRIGQIAREEAAHVRLIRSILERDNAIALIEDVGQPMVPLVRQMYRDGEVAAVDGTRAMSPLNFSRRSAAAWGVVAINSQRPYEPVVELAQIGHDGSPMPRRLDLASVTLRQLAIDLQEVRCDPSWVVSVQEALVRDVARMLAQDRALEMVMIDGPVATQNLLSQLVGREDILEPLLDTGRRIMGFYKQIDQVPHHDWIGIALRSGEMHIDREHVAYLSEEGGRFKDDEKVRTWVARHLGGPNPFVRVIYKIRAKAFGIECRLEDVPLAAAVLLVDPSPTVNHEIPRLLEIADVRCRRTYQGDDMQKAVLGRIMRSNLPLAMAMTGEREYR